jgi:hypothetical protein
VTAKSLSIKDAKRKSGGCAWKAEKLTSGDLPFCPEFETERTVRFSDPTAELSRGRSMRRRFVERDTRSKEEKQLVLNETVTTAKARTVPIWG